MRQAIVAVFLAVVVGVAGCGHGPVKQAASGGAAGGTYADAQAAEARGDVAGAIAAYRGAASTSPSDAKVLYRLGVLYGDQKKYAEAARAWERYVALEPKSAEGWGNLGQAYEQAGDLKNAERAFKQGIEADPEDHSCKINYGMMLVRHGREAEGRKVLLEVMKPAEVEESLKNR